MKLTKRETATVLAALRNWQNDIEYHNPMDLMPHHFVDEEPLSSNEIEALCERINCDD